MQIPTWDRRLFDLEKAAESQTVLRRGAGRGRGLQVTELSRHLQGQLVAVHPAYDARSMVRARRVRRQAAGACRWALSSSSWRRGRRAGSASPRHATFPGALQPYLYPWPAAGGSGRDGVRELRGAGGDRFSTHSRKRASTLYEIHPGEDLHDA